MLEMAGEVVLERTRTIAVEKTEAEKDSLNLSTPSDHLCTTICTNIGECLLGSVCLVRPGELYVLRHDKNDYLHRNNHLVR